MAKAFAIRCKSCKTQYVLPVSFREPLEGSAVFCAACERWWVAIPASAGPPVKLVQGRPERARVDLSKFRRAPTAQPKPATPPAAAPPLPPAPMPATPPASPAPAAPAAADPGELTGTTSIPVKPAAGAPLSLRVVVTGPELDLKGIFDLGAKGFLIGREGCHLNLSQASIPAKAVRVKAAEPGFTFEGLEGFSIPIGPVSIQSGRIDPGGNLSLALEPYEILLEPSSTPGSPIADLEPTPQAPPPPEPAWPDARRPESPGPRPATDLREQLQELAVDVRGDQPAFGDAQEAAAVDLDATMTDLGASGFQAMRFGNPLAGLDLRLVRADGPGKGQAFKVTKSPLLIGRSAGGDVTIADRRVSSKHAQLDVAGPRVYTLKDLASTNGTTVNDRPVSVAHLEDGDVISFGGVKFEFLARKAP